MTGTAEGLALDNLGIAYRELRRFEEAVDQLPAGAGDLPGGR